MTYLAATIEGNIPKEGKVMLFDVAGKKVKFFYQTEDKCLSHYESGRIVAPHSKINSVIIADKLAHGTNKGTLTDRSACEIALHDIIKKNGVDRVMAVFNSAPKINA